MSKKTETFNPRAWEVRAAKVLFYRLADEEVAAYRRYEDALGSCFMKASRRAWWLYQRLLHREEQRSTMRRRGR